MEWLWTALFALLAGFVVVKVRGPAVAIPNGPMPVPPLSTGTTQLIPPTNAYEPKPDTGAPEPKPDEEYPEPGQPDPEDLPELPDEEPAPPPELPPSVPQNPTPPPLPAPAKPRVYTAAEQDAFFKAMGWPYGTPAKRKASTWEFQNLCTWTDLVRDSSFGEKTTAAAETCRANNYRIARYFHAYEVRCKGQDVAQGSGRHCSSNCRIIHFHRDVLRALDIEREQTYQGPLSITNGYRCDGYNAYVGGVKASAHRLGLAADIPRKFSWRRFINKKWRGIGKSRVDRESVVHLDQDTRLPLNYVFQE